MARQLIERLSIEDDHLWIEDGGRPRGYPLGSVELRDWLNDTRDRLNALATVPDPAALMVAVQEVLRTGKANAEAIESYSVVIMGQEQDKEGLTRYYNAMVAAQEAHDAALRRLGEVMGK